MTYSNPVIWNQRRLELLVTQSYNKSAQNTLLSRKHSSTHSSSCSRRAGHLANIASATPTMSAFVNSGGLALTSDSKHAGVESITMAMARTPRRYQGPVGPSCPALSTPCMCFTEGPHRSGLPRRPSGADLRGVLGSWSNKKSLERRLQGRGYGV